MLLKLRVFNVPGLNKCFPSIWEEDFLLIGQGFPYQLPVLENSIYVNVRHVACNDVTISVRYLFSLRNYIYFAEF